MGYYTSFLATLGSEKARQSCPYSDTAIRLDEQATSFQPAPQLSSVGSFTWPDHLRSEKPDPIHPVDCTRGATARRHCAYALSTQQRRDSHTRRPGGQRSLSLPLRLSWLRHGSLQATSSISPQPKHPQQAKKRYGGNEDEIRSTVRMDLDAMNYYHHHQPNMEKMMMNGVP